MINNGDKSADILIFPILTNANHGIELYMKGIMWTLNNIMKSEMKIEGSHNFKKIFKTVTAKVKIYNGKINFEVFTHSMQQLQHYIIELFEKINATPQEDKMDLSRYPFNNKYENHFNIDVVGNVEVDLENFVSRFESIKQTLENIYDFLVYEELYKGDE